MADPPEPDKLLILGAARYVATEADHAQPRPSELARL
jgi:hypothetical protein